MNRLFNRLFLASTIIVLLLFVALWQWLQLNHEFNRNQIQQSLHLQLAEHMAHINPLLSQGITSDAALKEAFHDFMLLGPSFEIYTLDPDGKVIAYDAKEEKIKIHRVDTAIIQQFLNGDNLPVLGTDPRSEDTHKIFSASKLITEDGLHSGYLYVIIGGEDYDSWQTLINAENQPKIWGATIGFWIIFALVLFVILLRYFTRPIQKLAQDLTELKNTPMSDKLILPQRYRGSLEISLLSHHINHLLQEIQLQQQQVKRQQQAKHDFLLHLSHDLKTPLTALLGYIDTWLILPENERDQALIQYAANSGQTLQQLLAQLLELAALENGQIDAQLQQVNLSELLCDIEQTFTPRAKKLGVQLDFDINHASQIYTDPALMRRILNNLVDNALRYTPAGGKIQIINALHNGQQWLTVRDTGAGMHQHEVDALKQLSMTTLSFEANQSLPQLGVGLAIVRQLLGLLKCRIEIDSQPGVGSEFKIELVSKS
ncbi:MULTISPECIES: sensor histidine kinase [Shewanella]|uniref:histidine kinase n=2 Tax=Gammaproteobacteria TaxID=1236 RepID=A0A3N4DLS3_9GAMM|nr:HAMP domain-containing sensor histidine kinase [Shewanella psychromarinicola]AZG33789.1 sensor histidine kinase [Shewanella psychromarinicola]MCL1084065.1 HAMP domain-containing histidine kinase [Shewanella psychromarinicola]RPA22560.1 sensor histidine kinase [Shewanella psychromarinicola]